MNIAVIFAGGVGKRMNNAATPKQFLKLHGKEIIVYTLEKFNFCNEIDAIVVSCLENWISYLERCVRKYELHKVKSVISGGETGQESIYHGLLEAEKISKQEVDPAEGEKTIVLIHDGVRPLIDTRTIQKNIQSVKKYGSAITVTPAVETVIQMGNQENEQVRSISDRSECWLARAPQSFYLDEILAAHHQAKQENKQDFIDSASLMKYYGIPLYTVKGPVENIKITTPADYYAFKAYCEAEEDSQVFGI